MTFDDAVTYLAEMSFLMSSRLTFWCICLYTSSTSDFSPNTFSPRCLWMKETCIDKYHVVLLYHIMSDWAVYACVLSKLQLTS